LEKRTYVREVIDYADRLLGEAGAGKRAVPDVS